jgi:hypothetical protein
LFDLFFGNLSNVGLLGQEASDQSDHVFNGSFFPAMIGIAEVRVCAKDFIGTFMFNVFFTVVIGDRCNATT